MNPSEKIQNHMFSNYNITIPLKNIPTYTDSYKKKVILEDLNSSKNSLFNKKPNNEIPYDLYKQRNKILDNIRYIRNEQNKIENRILNLLYPTEDEETIKMEEETTDMPIKKPKISRITN